MLPEQIWYSDLKLSPDTQYTPPKGKLFYQYNIHGLVECPGTTAQVSITAAENFVKNSIAKYISRNSEAQLHRQTKAPASEWEGISWDVSKDRYKVNITITRGDKPTFVGYYLDMDSAVIAKKRGNIKYGLGEYTGRKEV